MSKNNSFLIEIKEDHPVIKKILEFIETEIKTEPDEGIRHIKYNSYLGTLPEDELVIYAIYIRISLVPAIYEYNINNGLSYSDFSRLFCLLGSQY